MVTVNTHGNRFCLEMFVLISGVSGFFYHRVYSKTRNPRKILLLLFFEVRFFPNIIY